MHKAILSVVCLLPICALGAQAAPPVKSDKASASLCKAPETTLFHCTASDKASSICQNGKQVIFRHGWAGEKAELEVVSNGHDGRAHTYSARMGSNTNGIGAVAHQDRMRFSWRGLDFVAFVTDMGTRFESGLAIEKDNISLSHSICKPARHSDFSVPSFVDEETEEKHKGVY